MRHRRHHVGHVGYPEFYACPAVYILPIQQGYDQIALQKAFNVGVEDVLAVRLVLKLGVSMWQESRHAKGNTQRIYLFEVPPLVLVE